MIAGGGVESSLSELLESPVAEAVAPDPELLTALAALAPNQRATLILFYFERLTTDEVAEELGVRPSTARSHLHRRRAELARRLSIPEVVTDGH